MANYALVTHGLLMRIFCMCYLRWTLTLTLTLALALTLTLTLTLTLSRSDWTPYFTLPRVRSIAHQCLTALAYIHSLDLIHCDLKPENVLIKSLSRCLVKVIDFGSSCFMRDPHSSYVQVS